MFKVGKIGFLGLALTGLIIAGLFSGGQVEARFVKEINRYVDTLTTVEDEAVYNYYYINTSPEPAIGYFEMNFGSLNEEIAVSDVIEVRSISETYPIDYEKLDVNGSVMKDISVEDAVYSDDDGLKVRVGPQGDCTPREKGGCENTMIPDDVLSKISITVGLKQGVELKEGSFWAKGQIYFPNGYDINPIYWAINVGVEEGEDFDSIVSGDVISNDVAMSIIDRHLNPDQSEEEIKEEVEKKSDEDEDKEYIKLIIITSASLVAAVLIAYLAYYFTQKGKKDYKKRGKTKISKAGKKLK